MLYKWLETKVEGRMTFQSLLLTFFPVLALQDGPGRGMRFIFPGLSGNPASLLLPLAAIED